MVIEWHDVVGTMGVTLILGAYLLLQLRRLNSDMLVFSVTNAVGSTLILISLLQVFNFSAFVIEFAWLLISLYGVARIGLLRR